MFFLLSILSELDHRMDAKSSSSSSSLVSDTNEKKTSGDDSFRDGLVDEINRKRKRAEEMEQELHRVNKELRRANKELKDYDYKKEQERNRFEWERVLSDHSKWRVFYEEYKGFKKSYSDVIQSSLRPILDACLRVNEDEVKSLIQFALDNEFRLGYSPLNPKFVMKYLDFSMDTSKRKWSVEEAEQFAKKWQIFNITCNKAFVILFCEITTTKEMNIIRSIMWIHPNPSDG